MDDLEGLRVAGEEFERRLASIGAEQWSAPTRCGDWDVATLVEHVCLGNRMAELLLHGADATTSVGPLARTPAGVAPADAYTTSTTGQLAAFSEPDALTRTVSHPALEMSGDILLMFRTLDLAMHAWDLALAIEAAEALDADLCALLWTRLEPFAPLLPASGMFAAPTRTLGPDPSAQESLLHATGR